MLSKTDLLQAQFSDAVRLLELYSSSRDDEPDLLLSHNDSGCLGLNCSSQLAVWRSDKGATCTAGSGKHHRTGVQTLEACHAAGVEQRCCSTKCGGAGGGPWPGLAMSVCYASAHCKLT